jgi:hypothetical protein
MAVMVSPRLASPSASAAHCGRLEVALEPPKRFPRPFPEFAFKVGDRFANGCADRVIMSFRLEIWAGGDDVDRHAEGGALFPVALQAHVGLVNLEPRLKGENSLFHQ